MSIVSTTQRYFILAATSLPEGTAFAVNASHLHLLTQFALGALSVQEVIDSLAVQSLTPPIAAVR